MDLDEIRRRIDQLAAEVDSPDPETQPELADYDDYLRTKLWARIRERVIKRDGGICCRCGGRGRQVHHRCYDVDVLRGERIEPLVTICNGCHEVVERDDQGRKRDMAEKDRVLFDLSEGVNVPGPRIDRRGNPFTPDSLRRATAIQILLWRRVADDRAERVRIRRSLARPGSSVKQRHPLIPALEIADCADATPGAVVVVEEVRFRSDPNQGPCWVVGRVTSPEDRARVEIDLAGRKRTVALRVLAGNWPFRGRGSTVGLGFPADACIRLVSAHGCRVLAQRRFRIARP